MKTTFNVYLHTGTNIGNRLENLKQANNLITEEIGTILECSKIYETAAWGVTNQAPFLNQAIAIQTMLTPKNLLEKVLAIETKMGRIRLKKWGERLIDIDILFYEKEIITLPTLTIPHPRLQDRNFVLVPMMEIASDFVHPIFNKTITQLYQETKDNLTVTIT